MGDLSLFDEGGGGAERAGVRLAVFAVAGAGGAGRPGIKLGWLIELVNCIGGLAPGTLRGTVWGMGGGARGFSKLAPWLEGKRGLAGGLVMVERVL